MDRHGDRVSAVDGPPADASNRKPEPAFPRAPARLKRPVTGLCLVDQRSRSYHAAEGTDQPGPARETGRQQYGPPMRDMIGSQRNSRDNKRNQEYRHEKDV